MDKNTIIGLLVIFGLFIGYSIYISPSKEERETLRKQQDSIKIAQIEAAIADSIALMEEVQKNQTVAVEGSDTNIAVTDLNLTSKYGAFTSASQTKNQDVVLVENDKYLIEIDPKGAQITSVTLKNILTYDKQPVVLFKKGNNDNKFGFTFFSNYLDVNTYDLYFEPYNLPQEEKLVVSGDDSLKIAMRLYPDGEEGIDSTSFIEFLYTIYGNDYLTDLSINFVNTEKYISKTQTQIELLWQAQLLQQEKSKKNEVTATTIYYSDIEDTEHLKEDPEKGDSTSYSTSLKWISFKQLFFSSAIIAKDRFSNATMVADMPTNNSHALKNLKSRIDMPLEGANPSLDISFYFGPNKYRTLKSYDIELENQVQLGGKVVSWINKWCVIPIFNFLEKFGWNYGIIILILTIIIKAILFPVTYKNYLSTAKMRIIKPEVEEINQRYPKQEDAMKKQQAVMALYKRSGVKPMAGCLPMLLQFPILIALFRFFPSAYELRQQPFLWADDLSTYDAILSWDTHIPILSTFYGNHVSLFTLLMTIATFAYTVINQKMMGTGNDQQMKMMKWMMYLMPIMFLGVFNNYSSGLSYYYLLVNLITFIQMGIFRLVVNEEKLHQKMQATKLKPVKKSKWQQRMEDMMKQQQAAAAQQRNGNSGLPTTKQRHNTSVTKKK